MSGVIVNESLWFKNRIFLTGYSVSLINMSHYGCKMDWQHFTLTVLMATALCMSCCSVQMSKVPHAVHLLWYKESGTLAIWAYCMTCQWKQTVLCLYRFCWATQVEVVLSKDSSRFDDYQINFWVFKCLLTLIMIWNTSANYFYYTVLSLKLLFCTIQKHKITRDFFKAFECIYACTIFTWNAQYVYLAPWNI